MPHDDPSEVTPTEEHHESQFRGCWCPPVIFDLIDNEVINIKEAWLLMIVESLVEHGGRDCFASNAYLGKRCQVATRQASEMVAHLQEVGVLIQTSFDGRKRYLRTSWSGEDPEAASRKTAYQPSEKSLGRVAKNCAQRIHTENKKDSNVSQPADAGVGPTDKPEIHPRWRRMAEKLHEAVRTVRQIDHTRQLPQWAKSFRLLCEHDKVDRVRIKRTLHWYCEHLGNGDKFLPVAHSGPSFREKFDRIEMTMQRQSSPSASPAPIVLSEMWIKCGETLSKEIKQNAQMVIDPLESGRVLKDTCAWTVQVKREFEKDKKACDYGLHVFTVQPVPIVDNYSNWIVRQVSSWEQWEGNMKEFLVGGKHWRRWLVRYQKSREWTPNKTEQRIIDETSKN